MSSRLLRRALLMVVCSMMLLPAVPANAAPLDYIIFDKDTQVDLGTFTVDPALASPMGTSNIDMSAFSMTDTISTYGTLTATLDEIASVTRPFVRFVNGQLTSISSNTQYELPGNIGVNIDIVPQPAPMDLEFVAVFQMTAFMLPSATNSHFGPAHGIGIREAAVPEPASVLLMGLGGAITAAVRRRRHRQGIVGDGQGQ